MVFHMKLNICVFCSDGGGVNFERYLIKIFYRLLELTITWPARCNATVKFPYRVNTVDPPVSSPALWRFTTLN